MIERVILVDENDKEVGTEEKIKVHKTGKLHRAFSIFIFNSRNELLIQQRAEIKYHCGTLWSNTVCGHPKPNESCTKAAHERLEEEMGFDCELKKIGHIIYRTTFENGLIENEYDYIFTGIYDKEPIPNDKEVMNYKWIKLEKLKEDFVQNHDNYTPWFKRILPNFYPKYLTLPGLGS